MKELRDYERLLVYLTYLRPEGIEKAEIERLVERLPAADWEEFFALALPSKTVPFACQQLRELGLWERVPAPTRTKMQEVADFVRKQNQERIDEATKFLSRFVAQGIPVAAIKGICLAETIYRNPYYKRMNDVDILVHRADIPRITAIYESLGYFAIQEPTSGQDAQGKQDKLSFVAPVYLSRDLKCVIGTQWGIKSPMTGYRIDYPGIWARMRPLDFHGVPILQMAPEDALHHLCLHLGYFKISARDLMDLYNIVRHYRDSFDWKLFEKIVDETGSENPVYHALALSNALHPEPAFEVQMNRVRSRVSRTYVRGVARKIRDLRVLLRLSTDYFQSVEKEVISFNAKEGVAARWTSYLRIWKLILFPPRAEVARMCALPPDASLGARVAARFEAPYRIFWVIASEISWLVVGLLLVKLGVDLWKTTLTAPFRPRNRKSPLQAYAEKIGMTVEELEKLHEHFE